MPELIVDLERVGVDAIAAGEGKNLKFERRSADRGDRLRSLAAELVRLKVDLILANGTRAARAAKEATEEATKEATKAIPIVFSLGEDPVTNGLVASFARPGGNLTGFDEGFFLDIAPGYRRRCDRGLVVQPVRHAQGDRLEYLQSRRRRHRSGGVLGGLPRDPARCVTPTRWGCRATF